MATEALCKMGTIEALSPFFLKGKTNSKPKKKKINLKKRMDFFFENGLRGLEALCFLFQVHSLLYLPSHNPEGRIYHFHVITEEDRWPRVGKPLA